MYTAKAIGFVETLIVKGAEDLSASSPALSRIFHSQVSQTLSRLRSEFRDAKEAGGTQTIWPKMVIKYLPDGDELTPVWGPIKNEQGQILGLHVHSETQGGVARRQRVHLDWAEPE